MKIIHISDLHLNTYFKNSHLEEIKFILNFIAKENFDHLIISGDLTDNADSQDFEILRDLFKRKDLLRGDRLSLMIGNHDVYGGIVTPNDIFTFHEKCEKINYHLRLNEFYLYFFETFENCAYRNDYYPYAKKFGDLLIVAMNSVMPYSKVRNPFASNGSVNLEQYNEVIKILEEFSSVKRKLIFTHHHFNKIKSLRTGGLYNVWNNIEKQTIKLKKKKRLFNMLRKYNVDLVLHGHYHKSEEYYRKGIRFLNAGATIKDSPRKTIRINIIEISKEKISVDIKKLDLNSHRGVYYPVNKTITGPEYPRIILQ